MSGYGYGNSALSGIQQGLEIGDHIFGAAGRRRQQALQEQQQIMALQDAQAMREHQAALRPYQLRQMEQAEKQQRYTQWQQERQQKARDAYTAARLARARGEEIDEGLLNDAVDLLGRHYGNEIDNDGSGKSPVGFIPYRNPEDKEAKPAYGLMLNVPQEGGDPRLAPLTRDRSSSPDDEVRLFTPEIFNQIGRENEWLIREVLGDLPTSMALSPELASNKRKYDSDEVLKLLAEAAGIKPDDMDEYEEPYRLGDSYVQRQIKGKNKGKVYQVASDWRGEANETKLRIARERAAAIHAQIDAKSKNGSLRHITDPDKRRQEYVKIAMKTKVMGDDGFLRQPTFDEAYAIASEKVTKEEAGKNTKSALDGGDAPAPNPAGSGTKPVAAPKPKSASYQEYLDAFNATKDPKKRQAINARAREMGIIK